MSGRWLSILGIGEDGVEGLSPAAAGVLREARLVVGGARHLALAAPLLGAERLAWPSPMEAAFPAILARRGTPVAVLASGDPWCWGVAATLARLVAPGETRCLPVASSLSLACARLGWALQEVAVLSACGRPLAALVPLLQPGARVLVLSAGADTPGEVAAMLRARGMGGSRVVVLEALGGPRERVREATADAFAPGGIDPLNLVALEVRAPAAACLPLVPGLPDALFEHDGQLTRRELRAAALSALAPRRGEVLWDVGCGAGSVGIEWMLCHPANRAIGVEADPQRAARAARNAEALGVPALRVVAGRAPDALAGLPPPDAGFIGGGLRDPALAAAVWAALPAGGRLVAHSVTLESDVVLAGLRARLGGTLTRLRRGAAGAAGHAARLPPGDAGHAAGGGAVMSGAVMNGGAMAGMLVAGLGCRPGCGAPDVLATLARALVLAAAPDRPACLAAPGFRRGEPGVLAAAHELGLPVRWIAADALAAEQPRCPTRSDAALRARGIASVAEAGALAAAGPGGVLLLPRISGAGVTVALARAAPAPVAPGRAALA